MVMLKVALGATEGASWLLRRAIARKARAAGAAPAAETGRHDRKEPRDRHEREAIERIREICAQRGETVEDVMWPARTGAARRAREQRSKVQGDLFTAYYLAFGLPVAAGGLLVLGSVLKLGETAGIAWFVGGTLLVLAMTAFVCAEIRRGHRLLALEPDEDASGKVVVVLSDRHLYKAWFVDGTKLMTSGIPRERARAVTAKGRLVVRDDIGDFVELDWTRQPSRLRIAAALGHAG